jgi:hypothetical protein
VADQLDVALTGRNHVERLGAALVRERDALDAERRRSFLDVDAERRDLVHHLPEVGVGGVRLTSVGVDRRREHQLVAQPEELADHPLVGADLEVLLALPLEDERAALLADAAPGGGGQAILDRLDQRLVGGVDVDRAQPEAGPKGRPMFERP